MSAKNKKKQEKKNPSTETMDCPNVAENKKNPTTDSYKSTNKK